MNMILGNLKRSSLFSLLVLVCMWGQVEGANIVFFGDSLTAGYGIEPDQAYPKLIEKKLKTIDGNWQILAAGVSGDTTAGGVRRVNWTLRKPIDIFVLALGANDGLRGQTLASTEENLQLILNKVKAKNPDVKFVIAGMKLPPSLGQEYTDGFEAIFPKVAEANDAVLIPFLLEGVAADPSLNQADQIHPNVKGHKIMAETVWKYLEALVQQK